jgi:hypothetical protein
VTDWLESQEAAAEDRYYEATRGLPPGKMRCGCGVVCDEGEMQPASPNPYASPVCPACCVKLYPPERCACKGTGRYLQSANSEGVVVWADCPIHEAP